MMSLGERIRAEREKMGLSREQFCKLENELTVRQLSRIELGESVPTLKTLSYIAKILKVTVSELMDEHVVVLPRKYLLEKHRLIRFVTYDVSEGIQVKLKMIKALKRAYSDQLPRSELEFIKTVEMIQKEKIGIKTFKQQFDLQIYLLRDNDNLNDLVKIELYLINDGSYSKVLCDHFLHHEIFLDEDSNVEFLIILNTFADNCIKDEKWSLLKQIIEKMNEVMVATRIYLFNPKILVLDAIYEYHFRHEKDIIDEKLATAKVLADNFNDEYLESYLKKINFFLT